MVAPQRGRRDRSRLYKPHGPDRPRARRATAGKAAGRSRGHRSTGRAALQRAGGGARLERGRSGAHARSEAPRHDDLGRNKQSPRWGDAAMDNLSVSGRRATRGVRDRTRRSADLATGRRRPPPSGAAFGQPNDSVQLRMDGRGSGRPPSAATSGWAAAVVRAPSRLRAVVLLPPLEDLHRSCSGQTPGQYVPFKRNNLSSVALEFPGSS